MLCPFCGKEMEDGTMFCAYASGIPCLPKGRRMQITSWDLHPPTEQGGFWLIPMYANGFPKSIRPSEAPIYFCRLCKKVIAEIPETNQG